jgi:glycogen synthase
MVTPRYFPYMGGVESHVYQVALRLAARGVDVTVLTTDPRGDLPVSEEQVGVHVRRVRAWPAGADWYFAPGLYRAIATGGWDIVHLQSYHTLVAPVAMLAAWRAKIPFVVTFHGGGHSSRLRNALRGVQQTLLRPLLRRARRLVIVARFELDLFSRRLGLPADRFALIPNGSDLPRVEPAAPREDGQTVIASVGRLERYKGHQRVLAALPGVLEQQPDALLRILGAGPYAGELRRLAGALGMTEHVEIMAIPAADREAMANALARCALVVLLSDYETQPIAIMEALALGRPALVADTSGLHELAERGWVRAIPVGSTAEQVAAAILDQLCGPLIPVGVRLPTWDDCASGLLRVYGEILT